MAEFVSDAFPKNSDIFLETFMDCIEGNIKHCRQKDIPRITKSLSKLNYKKGTNEQFIDKLISQAKNAYDTPFHSVKRSAINGRSVVEFNNYMSYMGYYIPETLNYLFETANLSSELHSARTFKDVMQSGTLAISRIGSKYHPFKISPNRLLARDVYTEATENIMQNQNALSDIWLLDSLVEINFPQYQGIRLDPTIKNSLSTLVRRQAENTLDHRLSKGILDDICNILYIRLQEETSCIYHGFLSPDSKTRDIAFCVDVNSSTPGDVKLMPLPRNFRNDLNKGSDIVWPNRYLEFVDQGDDTSFYNHNTSKTNYKWFAVVVPQQKFMYKSDTTLSRYKRIILDSEHTDCEHFHTPGYGPFHRRTTTLTNLGYNIIPVSYKILKDCKNKKGRRALRKLINERCVNRDCVT